LTPSGRQPKSARAAEYSLFLAIRSATGFIAMLALILDRP
jgi:hypothetical protein